MPLLLVLRLSQESDNISLCWIFKKSFLFFFFFFFLKVSDKPTSYNRRSHDDLCLTWEPSNAAFAVNFKTLCIQYKVLSCDSRSRKTWKKKPCCIQNWCGTRWALVIEYTLWLRTVKTYSQHSAATDDVDGAVQTAKYMSGTFIKLYSSLSQLVPRTLVSFGSSDQQVNEYIYDIVPYSYWKRVFVVRSHPFRPHCRKRE